MSSLSFPIGCNVTLQNLVKGSQYNGKHGIVKSNCDERGRQNVLLRDGNKMVSVKADNMKLVQSLWLCGDDEVQNKEDSNTKSNSGGKSLSKKKKRGKQRKKAANENTSVAVPQDVPKSINFSSHPNDNGLVVIKPEHKRHIAQFVRAGSDNTTRILSIYRVDNFSLQQSGVLSIALDFLKRCEWETFDEVAKSNKTFDQVMNSVGGDLKCPSTWIRLLIKSNELEPSCWLQIAENIGPLVKCMCNDMHCVFFRSNTRWRDAIGHFVELIHKMVGWGEESIEVLLRHEELLRSIIQWGFWGKETRADLIRELGVETCEAIGKLGRQITTVLIGRCFTFTDNTITVEGRSRLESIATTSIINKEYDSTCMVSFVGGLIQCMDATGWEGGISNNLLQVLIGNAYVDKGVIKSMIDLGLNSATYAEAVDLAGMSCDMVLRKSIEDGHRHILSDTRIAFAIRSGVLDMCLGFIEKFETELGTDKVIIIRASMCDESLLHYIEQMFECLHQTSLQKKTWKVIRHKRESIEAKLIQLGTRVSNDKCKKLLDMVRSTLNLNGSYCCRCNKSLTRTEVKLCNGCNKMVYCSRACQRDDWLNGGHRLTCNKSFTNELGGQFQGRVLPIATPENERDATKLKELETNMNMIQLKLFLDNSDTILNQAISLGIPLSDCIVDFDLRKCPPTIEVKKYTDIYIAAFKETMARDRILCTYSSSVYNGESDESNLVPVITMLRLFPHIWLLTQNEE